MHHHHRHHLHQLCQAAAIGRTSWARAFLYTEFTFDLFLPSVVWMFPDSVPSQSPPPPPRPTPPAPASPLQCLKRSSAITTLVSSNTACYFAAQTRRKVCSSPPLVCAVGSFLLLNVFLPPGTVLAALVSTSSSSGLRGDKCQCCLTVLGSHSQLLGPAEAELHVASWAHVDTVHGITAIPPPLPQWCFNK